MGTLFLNIVNMSVAATYVAVAVIILRFAFKKAPKWLNCFMWILVAIRLMCPFTIKSVLSLVPDTQIVSESADINIHTDNVSGAYGGFDSATNTEIPSGDIIIPAHSQIDVAEVLAIIWAIGVVAMIVYSFVSYFKIRSKVKTAVKVEDNIKLCDSIDTPFILGIFKPDIYIPFYTNEKDKEYIIDHEKTHLERRDHLWKPLGYLLLSVYWFNPVLWIAYILFCKDIELACDEKVIKEMDVEKRKYYSNALVNCSVPGRLLAASPLAFGEVAVKTRIKSILNYKKPAFWISILAVVAIVATSVCLLTDPVGEKIKKPTNNNVVTDGQEIPTTEGNIVSELITEIVTENITESTAFVEQVTGKVTENTTESTIGKNVVVGQITEKATETTTENNKKKPVSSNTEKTTSVNNAQSDTNDETVNDTTISETEISTEKTESTDPKIIPWGDSTDIILAFPGQTDEKGNLLKRRFTVPTALLMDGYNLLSYHYNDYMTYDDGKYNYLRLAFKKDESLPQYNLTLYYNGEKFRIYDIEGYEVEYYDMDWASETTEIKTKYYDGSGNFLYKKEYMENGAEVDETKFDTNDGWSAIIHTESFPDDRWEFYTDATGNPITKEEFEAHLAMKKLR